MPREKKSPSGSNLREDKNSTREEKCSSYQKIISSLSKSQKIIESSLGFHLRDLRSFERFVRLMYRPTDPASLGVARALFGLCMVIDVVEERGFADIDLKWGDPNGCHFPLIHGMQRPSLPIMILIYTLMWIGAFGIMLGFWFKFACPCFFIPYWYIFLLDKSFWNNHTYLYGIVAILFWGTGANRYFALDAKLLNEKKASVPLWNYFIVKFQFFALYFLAGLKKSSREWLEGYAMTNLSRHWVFDPFKTVLTTQQTDFFIVHWFGFIFDLTVGFWMLFPQTRIPAMVFCTAFHLMNSRLFSIGMFPYVCLATMPLFCNVDWPRKIRSRFTGKSNYTPKCKGTCENTEFVMKFEKMKEITNVDKKNETSSNEHCEEEKDSDLAAEFEDEKVCKERTKDSNEEENVRLKRRKKRSKKKSVSKRQKIVAALLLCHVALQFFLPYSHFITKGYNNWVQGLYGYSWDMMVHTWDIILVVTKVHDNANNEDLFIDPQAWVQNDRWAKHGDMVRQYAQCIKSNLLREKDRVLRSGKYEKSEDLEKWSKLSSNLSIYIDVWCSLNGRFQQRIFDPRVDMLNVDWHPFKPISYLMPLLTEFSSYRYKLDEIQKEVYKWSNYTDVFFVADYPGMQLENYISNDFSNVSVSVLEGTIAYSEEGSNENTSVTKGDWVPIKTGIFHTIKTTSSYPSCYMYTYTNQTEQDTDMAGEPKPAKRKREMLPILKEITYKMNAWFRVLGHMANSFFYLVYDVPMVRRVRNN